MYGGFGCLLPLEDSSDAEDDEVLTLTRMEALNSVNITEDTEMVRKVLQMMAVLGEDEASHKLTSVYLKCLDLTMEKRSLNTKQTLLTDFCIRLGCMDACMSINLWIFIQNLIVQYL